MADKEEKAKEISALEQACIEVCNTPAVRNPKAQAAVMRIPARVESIERKRKAAKSEK